MKKNKKTKRIYIRLSQKDYSWLEEKAGENISAYCRKILLQQSDKAEEETAKSIRELSYQIRKIGININQVAARMNAGISFSDDGETLKQELEKVRQLLKEFQENQVK